MSEEVETQNSPPLETPLEPAPSTTEEKSLLSEEEQTPAEPPAPLTAEDIKFPEGFEVKEEFRDEFLSVVNNQELSTKDRAQALTDLYSKAAQAASEASSIAWTEMQKTWQQEVRSDPTIGGEKLQSALGSINKLISEYGTPDLIGVFDLTGAGNNVHVIKFLNNVAQKLTEGGPASGTPAAVGEESVAQRLFPSMKGSN